jgi:hypothetical protein
MKEILEAIGNAVPVLQSSPMWVKTYFTIWLFASLGLILSFAFTYNSKAASPAAPVIHVQAGPNAVSNIWAMTGDNQIDRAYVELNSLATSQSSSEAQVVSALRNVFYKPVFRHIYEDQPGSALFTFCRAQLLLEAYVREFSSPDVRRTLVDATQNLISLQDQVAQLYGPTFQRECNSTKTLRAYTASLPPRQQDKLVGAQFDKAQYTLGTLRDKLKLLNLMD